MKNLLILVVFLTLVSVVYANNFLTIYNNNLGLFRTSIELDLQRGVQFYSLENIPANIISESVIFVPRDRNVQLFSQSFEFDLANTHRMIQRYIGQNVRLVTDQGQFSGKLIFFDFGNYGLLNETTNELNLVSAHKVNNVLLSEMPQDFYLRPTLRWQLSADRAGTYQAELSYLTRGIEWRATYNAVLAKNNFTLNSWVTINNRSGKDFKDVNLKLIAGDVETGQNRRRGAFVEADMAMGFMMTEAAPPAFEERAFSDFRIYTLDQKADIDNNQEKQLRLYPLKTVRHTRRYEYTVGGRSVDVLISFGNTTANGLGVPLPRGNVNFYELDERDNTPQFVGVATIDHTSINQDVNLRIGSAFDIVAETRTVNSQTIGRTQEQTFEVSLTNNKSEAVEIEAIRRIHSANVEILNPSVNFERRDAFTFVFRVRVPAGGTQRITFLERISG